MFRYLITILFTLVWINPLAAQAPSEQQENPPRRQMWEMKASPQGKLFVDSIGIDEWGREGPFYTPSACEVRLWDVATGKLKWTHRIRPQIINNLEFSPDGKRLIGVGLEVSALYEPAKDARSLVVVWEAASGKKLYELALDEGELASMISFSPDNKWLLGATQKSYSNADNMLRVWNARTGEPVLSQETGMVQRGILGFSADEKHILVSDTQSKNFKVTHREICLLSLPHLRVVGRWPMEAGDTTILALSPDKKKLLVKRELPTGPQQRPRLALWNIQARRWEWSSQPEHDYWANSPRSAAFFSKGQKIFAEGALVGEDGNWWPEVWIWNARSGQLERTVNNEKNIGPWPGSRFQALLMPNGESFLCLRDLDKVELRSLADAKVLQTFEVPPQL